MALQDEIRSMYREIVSYSGSFGDPINHGSYNPYEVIRDPSLTAFERTGVSVAILTYLECAIDNATYEDAVAAQGPKAKAVLSGGLLDHEPVIRTAVETFFDSEEVFLAALEQVFEKIVRPQVDA